MDQFAPDNYKKPDGSIDWGRRATEMYEHEMQQDAKVKSSLPLHNLSAFKLADEMSDFTWELVARWDQFSKKTIGDQLVRSADSVGANIAEGYGRYYFAENVVFLYYARGSLYETQYWADKAYRRKLMSSEEYQKLKRMLDTLPLELNTLIKVVKTESGRWKGGKRVNN